MIFVGLSAYILQLAFVIMVQIYFRLLWINFFGLQLQKSSSLRPQDKCVVICVQLLQRYIDKCIIRCVDLQLYDG